MAITTQWYHYNAPIKSEKGEVLGLATPLRGEDPKIKKHSGNNRHLDENGIVKKRSRVSAGDILVAKKIQTIVKKEIVAEECTSLLYDETEPAYVEDVKRIIDGDGYDCIMIKLSQVRIPRIGNKLASYHAQKGCIGMLINQEDMPVSHDGIVPDIVINAHAFPSRMTIAQLIESLTGKAACLSPDTCKVSIGDYFKLNDLRDCTPFDDPEQNPSIQGPSRLQRAEDELRKLGYEPKGESAFIDGISGLPLPTLLFHGPVYYRVLKHMSQDKKHARSRYGKRAALTIQPSEGRASGGGFKIGRMEADNIIGQGAAAMAKDRLMDQSDRFVQDMCKTCGIPAISKCRKDGGFDKSCPLCLKNDIGTIEIPYGMMLLNMELAAMNISTRLCF
jgi:DNA-directed RNA polymerase beta subunit